MSFVETGALSGARLSTSPASRVKVWELGRLVGSLPRIPETVMPVTAAKLAAPQQAMFSVGMGRLLDKLLRDYPAYDIRRDKDGFVLIGKPDRLDEFSDLVREAAEQAGEDFIVFTTTDGHHRYSQMFVMLLDEAVGASR